MRLAGLNFAELALSELTHGVIDSHNAVASASEYRVEFV